MVKKSGRYLLLYESNKEFKIDSYFSITLYWTAAQRLHAKVYKGLIISLLMDQQLLII